jgi:hypothetical protein
METKKILLIVLIAFVSFCVGLQTGVLLPSNVVADFNLKSKGSVVGAGTYQAGWEAAKKRVAEYGMVPMMGNMEIKSVSGEVVKIDGQKITLKIRPLEPLADPELDIRIATIGSDVKVYRLSAKDQKVYQKEMEETNAKMKVQKPEKGMPIVPPMMPSMFEKTEVKLSDIKAGTKISVLSADNIKDKKEFIASSIEIQIDYSTTPPAAALGAILPNPAAGSAAAVPPAAAPVNP